ncbi:MAG: phospho-N-acetylmuramoyl-pentapeptide-transferase [Chitinophagaceae bacterium]|nr:phospho-N-acetylmuramoyl-pentapeptide-transferase [Chitinophagaceae bacterium]
MFYYIFDYLETRFQLFGASVFQYLSFRAIMSMLLSLVITIILGKYIIRFLKKQEFKETIRDLGFTDQTQKKGTPTMGGIIIIMGIVIPTILFANIENIYIILLLFTTLVAGMIGFIDDYLKKIKQNKTGLSGIFKVIGQVFIGTVVGLVLVFHDKVIVRDYYNDMVDGKLVTAYEDIKLLVTTIPFFKDNELEYEYVFSFLGSYYWIGYVLLVIFIVTAISNGTNITDGLDGLAAGISAIIATTLAIFAYLSGNVVFSEYLNILYLPNTGEITIFCAALIGSCFGFLWYNSYPAQIFMGDTGSISLGAILAVLSIIIRKELLIPILCGIFVIENISVILQVSYFKYTKKKYGQGKRIFLMSPLHHHYQKKGIHEAKIVSRFWNVGILLALISLMTLKLR